jgi:hypothetical protein
MGPNKTSEELWCVGNALPQQARQRHDQIVHDDSYGVITEASLIASAAEAFLAYDREELQSVF